MEKPWNANPYFSLSLIRVQIYLFFPCRSNSFIFQLTASNDNEVVLPDNEAFPKNIFSNVAEKEIICCSFCPVKFDNNRAKRRHEISKHINKKPFECGKCNATFNVLVCNF